MLRQLIASGAVDFVAMDIKHFPDAEHYGAVTPLSQAMMDNVLRSIGILRRGGTEYEPAYHAFARYPYPAGTGDAAENVRRLSVCVP